MLGLVSNYSPNEHTIVGGELSLWLERLVKDDPVRKGKLFILRYNKLGVFVIAEWFDDPKGTFVDVFNIGKSLANFGHKEAQEVRLRLFNPLTAEETSKLTTQADSDYHHNLQDEDAEETERCELVARGE